ncbi:MAG: DUF3472 domain-containing protein [Akkermansia sp.]|nr:DUF3472 domain-containing protein [Akkermansia sp.]MBR3694937.1 DUF3472 domain-containing protein [Akkermansia sp.]
MKAITSILAGVVAMVAAVAPQAQADRYSDYWAPENMARRQCASVHLGYLPVIPNHTAAYQELVVEKSAPGTYFAANNFSCGYIGVQELIEKTEDGTRHVRKAIFSIWDAKDSGDNPHAAPEEERAKLVQKGRLVTTRRFGGEGTGGNSMRDFDWKEGEVIRTLVIERPDGEDFRQIAGYIWDPETKQWELLSCWRIQALSRGLGGGCGFVEDFCRNVESKKHERRATFGPAWRWDGKQWSAATEFRFTKDGNPNMEINCRLHPQLGYYSLATGGDIKPDAEFPLWQIKKLDKQAKPEQPGEDVMKLINAPKLEQK